MSRASKITSRIIQLTRGFHKLKNRIKLVANMVPDISPKAFNINSRASFKFDFFNSLY